MKFSDENGEPFSLIFSEDLKDLMKDAKAFLKLGSPESCAADPEVSNILKEQNTPSSGFEALPAPPMYNPILNSPSQSLEGNSSSGESVDSTDIMIMTKKRKSNPSTRKRNVRKERINKGLPYTNVNQHEVRERSVKEQCPSSC